MEQKNITLGIYIAPQRAVVISSVKSSGKVEIADTFTVEIQQQDDFTFGSTAAEIAEQCKQRGIKTDNIAVALDCRLYRQQIVHSEFSEIRQIAQTIKYDAEEALAINAVESAVAFEISRKTVSGSDVAVFAAEGNIISEIVMALASNGLDPVAVEPDGVCFRRMTAQLPQSRTLPKPVQMAVSNDKCFIVAGSDENQNSQVRTFVTSAKQKKNNLVAREIMLLTAAGGLSTEDRKVLLFDETGQIVPAQLSEYTPMAVEPLSAEQLVEINTENSTSKNMLDCIIAAGAVAALAAKTDKVDFRSAFLPYQGRREIFEKTAKIISICILVVFIAFGIYLQLKHYNITSSTRRLNKKFAAEYTIAMAGGKFRNSKDALSKLKREINRIKDVKSGLLSVSGQDSVEAKLALLFEAMNSVAPKVDIVIDKIAITTKTMTITGSTSPRGYLELFGSVDKHPRLQRGQSTYESKDGRDNFRLTIETK